MALIVKLVMRLVILVIALAPAVSIVRFLPELEPVIDSKFKLYPEKLMLFPITTGELTVRLLGENRPFDAELTEPSKVIFELFVSFKVTVKGPAFAAPMVNAS